MKIRLILGLLLMLSACTPASESTQPPDLASDGEAVSATEQVVGTVELTSTATPRPTNTSEPLPTATSEPTATVEPPLPEPTAVPTKVPESGFEILATQRQPIVTRGPSGSWNALYNDPGAVFYHEGQFHMFHNGFSGWPASSGINYHTSIDGLNWETMSEEPVFRATDYDIAGFTLVTTSGLVTDEGEWVLYLALLDSVSGNVEGVEFRRATADNPLGPWTLHEDVLLSRGSRGTWDESSIFEPMIIKQDAGYYMYYSGYDASGAARIGLALSEDGITWNKYDDPTTMEALFAESDPILTESLPWEKGGVQHASVTASPEGLVMFYRTPGNIVDDGTRMKLGVAISEDGLLWEKPGHNPVYRPGNVSGNFATYITSIVYHEDIFYLFVDGFLSNYSEVYVIQYQRNN